MREVVESGIAERLETLYEEDFEHFVRVASGIAGGMENGVDAVHDAFLACLRRRDTYRGLGTLEAWVWRAVVTSALKLARANRKYSNVDVDEILAHEHTEDVVPVVRNADIEGVRQAVRALPERQRVVLFLRYYADLDYLAIARILGIRPGTVGVSLSKAQITVRRALDDARGEGQI